MLFSLLKEYSDNLIWLLKDDWLSCLESTFLSLIARNVVTFSWVSRGYTVFLCFIKYCYRFVMQGGLLSFIMSLSSYVRPMFSLFIRYWISIDDWLILICWKLDRLLAAVCWLHRRAFMVCYDLSWIDSVDLQSF